MLNYCFIQTAAAYSTTVDRLCNGGTTTDDACNIAGEAIDEACFASLGLGDNATCIGSCGSQLASAAAICASTVSYFNFTASYSHGHGFVSLCMSCHYIALALAMYVR